MTVFVSVGDPAAELAALLNQTAVKDRSASATVTELFTPECINALLSGEAAKAKAAFSIAFSTISSMDVQDIAKLCDQICVCAVSSTDDSDLRLWVMMSVFNALNVESIKARVLTALLQYGLDSSLATSLQPSLSRVDQWLNEWALDDVVKARLLSLVTSLYDACGCPESAQTSRLRLLSISSEDKALREMQSQAASHAVSYVLKFGKVMILERLLSVITARKLPSSPLIDLLGLMCRGTMTDLDVFCKRHAEVLDQFGIAADLLRTYLRALTLCSLAFGRTTLSLKDDIQESLALSSVDDAEQVFIDAVSLGLVVGQIDENEGRIYITSCMFRSVDNDVWKYLQQRLQTWRDSVATVLPWSQHVQN